MKKLILTLAITLTTSAFASEIIKTCKTTVLVPEEGTFATQIDVIKDGSKYSAKVTQDAGTYVENKVSISEHKVRKGLDLSTDPDSSNLNQAESIVLHAMTLEEDPVFEGAFSSGIDLKKVRSAKVFVIGETGNMGMSAIVEAKDESGKIIGSFLGGFLLSACQ